MKRTRRKPLSPEAVAEAQRFKESVWGKRCAMCRGATPFAEAHHVVEAQEQRRRKLFPYDCRNALPLCRDCHERHTNASRRVPFRKLRPENIDYAYEVLGPFAADYIRARYPMQDQPEEKGT